MTINFIKAVLMKMLAVLLFLIAMVPNVSSTMLTTRSARINKACKDENWLGDGNCDPGNNNEGCGWDKFRDVSDCCKGPMAMKNCKDEKLCKCLDPSFTMNTKWNMVATTSARINKACTVRMRIGEATAIVIRATTTGAVAGIKFKAFLIAAKAFRL